MMDNYNIGWDEISGKCYYLLNQDDCALVQSDFLSLCRLICTCCKHKSENKMMHFDRTGINFLFWKKVLLQNYPKYSFLLG